MIIRNGVRLGSIVVEPKPAPKKPTAKKTAATKKAAAAQTSE